jgi:hypothetical protein
VLVKIKLKNSDDNVIVDDKVYEYLTTDPYLSQIKFVDNLRRHSSGCVVFQKTWKKAEGGYKTETIYLHKLLAEKFLMDTKSKSTSLIAVSKTLLGALVLLRVVNAKRVVRQDIRAYIKKTIVIEPSFP